MKKFILFFIFLFLTSALFAQRTYLKYSIGAEGGSTHHWGDLNVVDIRKHFGGTFNYYLTPYIPLELAVQAGTLDGQETDDPFRKFRNHYVTTAVTGQVHLGEFIKRLKNDYNPKREFTNNLLKGGFLGAGLGLVFNDQMKTYRNPNWPLTEGLDKDVEFIFPLQIGWDTSGFERRMIAGVKAQFNVVAGDNVDGYSTGKHNDAFGTVGITLKYKFGFEGQSRF